LILINAIMKKILVAPLNWGIGHATRCVPIINELLAKGFEPIIASDGDALSYLEQEFPNVYSFELPSYNIKYSSKSLFFKLRLLAQIPKIIRAVKAEHKLIQQIIKKENIKGIISDNRFGVQSDLVPSVYITHQIQVLSGITTFFTSKIHQFIIQKFDAIWIPDIKNINLSGKLSNVDGIKIQPEFIGVLSRFRQKLVTKNNDFEYDLLVLLSGIEPQRSILEEKLIFEFKNYSKKVLFVRGKIDLKTTLENTTNITFVNFLKQEELYKSIIKSRFIIARSGYSTIMDLAVLQKKCFFIPTPNQNEQVYLAKHLDELKIAPFANQSSFSLDKLGDFENYTGFTNVIDNLNLPLAIFK